MIKKTTMQKHKRTLGRITFKLIDNKKLNKEVVI